MTAPILLITRLLADEHDRGALRPLAEYGLRRIDEPEGQAARLGRRAPRGTRVTLHLGEAPAR